MINEGFNALPPKGERQPDVKKIEGSLAGRALRKGGAGAVKIIALPLYLAAQTPRALSLAAKPLSAASRVVAGGFVAVGSIGTFASRSIKWTLNQAHQRNVLEHTSTAFKNLVETTTRRADQVSDAKKDQNAAISKGTGYIFKKAIGLIPIAGDLAEMAIDGALEADRVIKETDRFISRKATGGAKAYLSSAADAIRIAGPILLKGGAQLAETSEKAFEALRDKSWTVIQGKGYGISATTSDLADILTGWTLDLAHYFDEECNIDNDLQDLEQITPAEALEHLNTKEELWRNFNALSRQEKADLFFLVSISKECNLSDEQKKLYASVLSANLTGAVLTDTQTAHLKELVGMFDLLKDEEKGRLTPHAFQALDGLKKIQIFQIVRENAQNLTFEEGALLNKKSYRKIKTAAQWEALPTVERNLLEYQIARLFNTLPQATKELRHNITPAMCLALGEDAQQSLYDMLAEKVKSKKDSAQWEKVKIPFDQYSAQIVSNMFAKHLTKEEKFVEWSQLQGGSCVFAAGLSELDTLIKTNQKHLNVLKGSKSNQNSPEISRLVKLIETLEHEKSLLMTGEAQVTVEELPEPKEFSKLTIDAAKPIDVAAVMQQVGPHIISDKSALKKTGAAVGDALKQVTNLPGLAGWIVSRAIGKACAAEIKGFGIGEGFQITARGLEILLSTQWGIALFNTTLLKLGVPVAEIEKLLAMGPAIIGEGLLGIQGLILQTAQKSLDASNSFLGSILSVHEQIALKARLPEIEKELKLLQPALDQAKEGFALNVIDAKVLPGVLDAPSFIPANPDVYAKFSDASGLSFGTPQYWKAFQEYLEEGRQPGVLTLTDHVAHAVEEGGSLVQTIVSAPFVIGATTAKVAYKPFRWLASWAVDVDKYERAGGYYYKAATENAAADTLRWGAQKAGSAVRSVGEGAKKILTNTVHAATTHSQPLQGDVKESFMHMARLGKEFAELIQQKNDAEAAISAIRVLQESTIGTIALYAASSNAVKSVSETIRTTINPTIQFAVRNLEAMHNAALGNHEFLTSHLTELQEAPNPVAGLLAGAMSQLESGASEKLTKENSWTNSLMSTTSYVAPIASNALAVAGYLYGGSWSNYCLTALVAQNVLPPVLRTLAPIIKNSKPFWYGVAEQSLAATDATGEKLKEGCTALGGWFQRLWNMGVGTKVGYVDQKRAENFVNLDPLEQEHLIQLALQSDRVPESEKEALKKNRSSLLTYRDQALVNAQQEFGKQVLAILDRMTKQELMWLSPTFYYGLDERTKIRISDVVEKYCGLSEQERNDVKAIVEKFNSLKPEQKEEIDQLQASEYRQLSLGDQKGVCFQLALMEAAKSFAEPSLEGGLIFNPQAFALEHYEQFKRIESMDNQQLQKLLGTLKDPPATLLSQLYVSSDAKVQHCYELVKKYNSSGVYALKDAGLGNLRLFEKENIPLSMKQKLYPQLAILFNQLEPHQKDRLLLLTEEEVLSMEPEELHRIIAFLLSRPELSQERSTLSRCLIEELDEDTRLYLLEQFNGLEVLVQAEFREKNQLGAQVEEKLFATVKGQVEKLQTKLQLIEARSAQLQTKDYMALHHKTGEYKDTYLVLKKKNLDRSIKELESKKSHATTDKEIAEKKAEREAIVEELKKLRTNSAALKGSIDAIIAGIGRLENEAATIRSEIQALGLLLNDAQREKIGIKQQRSQLNPEQKKSFDIGIEAAVSVDKGAFKQVLIDRLKKVSAINRIALDAAKSDHIDLMTSWNKVFEERKQITAQMIASHRERMAVLETAILKTPNNESFAVDDRLRDLITLRLELSVLEEFYLPLYDKLIKANNSLIANYDAEAEQVIAEKKEEALGTKK